MADIYLDIRCGICGEEKVDIEQEGDVLTAICPGCKALNARLEHQVGELEDQIFYLEKEAT